MNVHRNATAASGAGALTILLVWAASTAGLDVPPEAASAFTTVVAGDTLYLGKRSRKPRRRRRRPPP